ncbi:GPI ethanolamine phosphate transferase 1 [Neolecta irregularis DAH-3]|uniref:GPI ethanolamine phosphate transferase 1 n=1 Tax=Neolecta irregularis (strain DAH-3) TaxID=1198029 RepID=A0A1U7LH19_NEOID|nr:GPI ethanolamine phosphate transferase 1 [Neolecta irregularis DAH-3]|eukprot:OLL21944.1 GPI ethanolamine phosphate transferase 1 [Neolecta irregularis DAH-3]
MKHFSIDAPAPSKRLFLVVGTLSKFDSIGTDNGQGDGLRADKLFQEHNDPDTGERRHLAPFLRSIVLNNGTFGVSHTRVPTESRPGHVAIIAGFYEDVSAVTKGWKMNPVNFDSVFNQSRHTWSFGSPDILPMFAHGASDITRVDTFSYGEEAEDFTEDATKLDTWVFDQVANLFRKATVDKPLDASLRQNQTVFFLHLLGLDTAGHAHRPYSKEYLRGIKVVDEGVRNLVSMVNRFYGDDDTAFVFTADHGMSDWGSHGDGHPDNTRTPIIAWGSGVARPDKYSITGHDAFSSDWSLNEVKRVDVNQADIAPLMSYLAGINIPANSVGQIPLDFLAASKEVKSRAALANAKQIIEQYLVKETEKRASEIAFRPFEAFAGAKDNSPDSRIRTIKTLMLNEEFDKSIEQSLELVDLGLKGLRYLQTHHSICCISLTWYIGWIGYALVNVLETYVLNTRAQEQANLLPLISTLGILYVVLFMKLSPSVYYAYVFFPVMFLGRVWAKRRILIDGSRFLLKNIDSKKDCVKLMRNIVVPIIFLEAMVIGYFHRSVFSLCFVVIAARTFLYKSKFRRENRLLLASWTACCLGMSVFTLLPVGKAESETLV